MPFCHVVSIHLEAISIPLTEKPLPTSSPRTQNQPLYLVTTKPDAEHEFHLIVHTSLDVIEDKGETRDVILHLRVCVESRCVFSAPSPWLLEPTTQYWLIPGFSMQYHLWGRVRQTPETPTLGSFTHRKTTGFTAT